MGDEPQGDILVHLNVGFSSETSTVNSEICKYAAHREGTEVLKSVESKSVRWNAGCAERCMPGVGRGKIWRA